MRDDTAPSPLRLRLTRHLAEASEADLPAIIDATYDPATDPHNPTPDEARQIWEYLDASRAQATHDAYRADVADYTTWCEARGLLAIPGQPGTVARYLVDRAATHKVSTLTRRLTAISQTHQARGCESPTSSALVRKVFAGIRRVKGTAQKGKAPLLPDDLRAMDAHYGPGLIGLRDRALLLLGFAGALRRSELVGLDLADLDERPQGLVITLRHSKTDQDGEGMRKGIPRGRYPATCPVRAVAAWVEAASLTDGPLFRPIDRHGRVSSERLADYSVVRVVKRLTQAIGLDPDDYGGHSLRAGLATAAAAAGVHERDIMRQTGHRSVAMLRRYIREGELFRDNAAAGLL